MRPVSSAENCEIMCTGWKYVVHCWSQSFPLEPPLRENHLEPESVKHSLRVHCLYFKVLYNSPHPEIQAQMLSAENALICFIIVPPFQPSVPLLAGPPLPRFLFPTRISHFPRIYPTSSSTANKWAQEFFYIVQACVATLSFIMPPILIHSLS